MPKLSAHPNGEGEQDFELNLAAIIDCFVVLITYLLASASFLSVAVMDVTAAAPSAQVISNKDASIDVAVDLYRDHRMRIQIMGDANRKIEIPDEGGSWNFAAFAEHLKSIKHEFPRLEVVVISGEADLAYDPLVRAVEIARNTVPAVSLGSESER